MLLLEDVICERSLNKYIALHCLINSPFHVLPRFGCPQCGNISPDLGSFQMHVLTDHEEVLLAWLGKNGFLGLD